MWSFLQIFLQEIKLPSLIKLENITRTYKAGDESYHALKDIHFELEPGELTAIVGASGSGKTSLMNIMGFLDHATAGQYYFNGSDVSSLNHMALAKIRNQKIGFIFQSYFLLPRLTILQNVMLPLFYRELPEAVAIEKAFHLLQKLSMEKFANHKPSQLSGGQQQRVAIARALIGDPEVIFADEPTGALDAKTSQEIMNIFLQLNTFENRTIVIITHEKDISQQCARIVTLADGRIVS